MSSKTMPGGVAKKIHSIDLRQTGVSFVDMSFRRGDFDIFEILFSDIHMNGLGTFKIGAQVLNSSGGPESGGIYSRMVSRFGESSDNSVEVVNEITMPYYPASNTYRINGKIVLNSRGYDFSGVEDNPPFDYNYWCGGKWGTGEVGGGTINADFYGMRFSFQAPVNNGKIIVLGIS